MTETLVAQPVVGDPPLAPMVEGFTMANRRVRLMRACPALVCGWPRLSELPPTNATDPALATLAAEG